MAAKISNFFKKKPPKVRQQGSGNADDQSSDEEGYMDPIASCPTEPPTRIAAIPNYPPPRPASPKTTTKNAVAKRDDYQDPWDSKAKNDTSTTPRKKGGGDTYQDPHDSRMLSSQYDYADPFDTKFSKAADDKHKRSPRSAADGSDDDAGEDYDEPYEERHPNDSSQQQSSAGDRSALNDTYEDPWDTKRKIDLAEGMDRPKSVSSSQVLNIKKAAAGAGQHHKDDYVDPWDSKVSSSLKSEEYDETYSEPYDKGKQSILDEPRRKSNPAVSNAADDEGLYDIPFEEKAAILGITTTNGASDGPVNFRASKVKQKDMPQKPPQKPPPKPPTPYSGGGVSVTTAGPPLSGAGLGGGGGIDYDSPWEWNVNKVEKEFVKRFSESGKQQPVPKPRKSVAAINPNANPIKKPERTNPPKVNTENREVNDYQVDPTIPLENQGWFHGHIRRGEAESLLHNHPDCSYLLRNSESSKIDYSLSLRNRGAPMHLKISYRDGRYILGINSRPYDTIPEMIHHYSMNMLNIRGAEHVKLMYPVFQENMYFTVEPGS